MRIGLFTDQFSVGISGQTTSITMLYHYFKQHGHDCYIFTSHSEQLADDDPDVVNLPGHPYPMKNMREYRFSPFIKRHIKVIASYRLDVIHVHTEYYLARIALAAKRSWGSPWFTRCTPCGNTISTIFQSRSTISRTSRFGGVCATRYSPDWRAAQI